MDPFVNIIEFRIKKTVQFENPITLHINYEIITFHSSSYTAKSSNQNMIFSHAIVSHCTMYDTNNKKKEQRQCYVGYSSTHIETIGRISVSQQQRCTHHTKRKQQQHFGTQLCQRESQLCQTRQDRAIACSVCVHGAFVPFASNETRSRCNTSQCAQLRNLIFHFKLMMHVYIYTVEFISIWGVCLCACFWYKMI